MSNDPAQIPGPSTWVTLGVEDARQIHGYLLTIPTNSDGEFSPELRRLIDQLGALIEQVPGRRQSAQEAVADAERRLALAYERGDWKERHHELGANRPTSAEWGAAFYDMREERNTARAALAAAREAREPGSGVGSKQRAIAALWVAFRDEGALNAAATWNAFEVADILARALRGREPQADLDGLIDGTLRAQAGGGGDPA